ncbi:MAG: Kazal-type serine protease inhibitor [Bacteroidota bacterium]|nr:Kazal-type serine protease inhibitor [Bacteroidota bacterium]
MKKLLLIFLGLSLVFGCNDDSEEDVPNMCVDETLINSESPCPAVVDPVCGCNGITYNNSCEAFNWHGVIAYAEGPCD